MTPSQFLQVLRARWLVFLGVVAVVVGAAAVASLLTKPTYTATASVLIDLSPRDPLTGAVGAEGGSRGEASIATQIDLIRSERVVLGAVSALGLADDASMGFRKAWAEAQAGRDVQEADYEAWIAEQVQKRLEVSPTRESGVLTLSFKAGSPVVAARVANAIVDSFIDTSLQMRIGPARQSSAFFEERARQLREKLEAAQLRLLAYQRSKGVILSGERLDVESTRLAELSSQLVALQAVADESSSREAQSQRGAERMPEVLASPVVASLSAELSRQQARLSELSARLGDNHPQVQETTASIAKLREQLAATTRQVTAGVGVTNAVNQARIQQLRAAIAEQRAKVLRLGSQNDEASVLQRDVQSAQRAYDMVLARATQTALESLNTQTNVSVLKRASVPLQPSAPRLRVNLSLALVLALMLAPCIVMLLELSDRRLRGANDVIDGLGLPLLVTIPKRAPAARLGRPSRRLLGAWR